MKPKFGLMIKHLKFIKIPMYVTNVINKIWSPKIPNLQHFDSLNLYLFDYQKNLSHFVTLPLFSKEIVSFDTKGVANLSVSLTL